ncbi:FMN-binding negative transcriptional regulator [Rubrivivax gelatinosus]|uniref:PaiB family negative transcriptional regulator n=1 Tax=Rubrivivax gelatinosus TaxID=28068 RepID=A0ABS1DYA8_RUBGE|nr:FMN-binding negative transcriptional regulator [Rubrivivax gelatinosus]MBK1714734.1 hypothetical protein [Rubrivivax gelatinosus]
MSSHRFDARDAQDFADLVQAHPLAWISSRGPDGPHATPLPLLVEYGADGRPVAIEGHFARANPQVAALRQDPEALVLWLGAQGYVSPSWMQDRTQAPSWNYASAQCRVRVAFVDDEALHQHLDLLSRQHEGARPCAWASAEMGPRLHELARRVVGFRAEVLELRQRYKLGQDERDDVYADILTGLRTGGAGELQDWMCRFNPGRGPAATTIDPHAAADPGDAP